MKNKSLKRLLILVMILGGFALLGKILQSRCSEHPGIFDIETPFSIDYLYPWPDAKIPFMCQTWAFLKSPFAPDVYNGEDVFKENGYRVLRRRYREGVIVVRINYIGEIYRQFPERIRSGRTHAFADALSLYVDGEKLEIGHAGYMESYFGFNFATILNPFLWPGEHVGKIVILLPSGETMEYEWQFEITWW